MLAISRLILLLLLALVTTPAGKAIAEGRLVIGGGALERSNAVIWEALIEGLPPEGRIAVIPGASGEPAQAAESFRETLAVYGIAPERMDTIRLAMMDDPSTPDIDESAWSGNAHDPDEIARIEAADLIWLTGGDQARLADMLLTENGASTPMLAAIRDRLAAGATVGGSSAGAAILSCPIISRGDTMTALAHPVMRGRRGEERPDNGALVMEEGACLFAFGLIDQHFDRQARLGRLARALGELPPADRKGFGIDENTVMIVDVERASFRVEGAGSVTVIDGRGADFTNAPRRVWAVSGLRLSVLSAGDTYDMVTGRTTPASFKAPIVQGAEYHDRPAPDGAGMALPQADLGESLGADLVDNSAAQRIERISFGSAGSGVRYVFAQDARSGGAWGRDAMGRGRYTVDNVDFAIEPVNIRVRPQRR